VVGRRLCIEHFGGIFIHGNVVIGDDCLIRQGVTIGNKGRADPLGAPVIGNRVEIGAGAKIIGRIVIGDDVIIGANSVVVKDIPSNSVAVGIPAKVILHK
jgi:serine O-acetyltransferase